MHPILKLLSRKVRAYRLARGMELEELCEKAGVTLYLLTRIKAAKGNPGIDLMFRLARALDAHPADLFKPPKKTRRRG